MRKANTQTAFDKAAKAIREFDKTAKAIREMNDKPKPMTPERLAQLAWASTPEGCDKLKAEIERCWKLEKELRGQIYPLAGYLLMNHDQARDENPCEAAVTIIRAMVEENARLKDELEKK